jgi:hypothetical protein
MTPMIDPTTKAGARAAERLERELILWLTTVSPAGQPQAWKHPILCAAGPRSVATPAPCNESRSSTLRSKPGMLPGPESVPERSVVGAESFHGVRSGWPAQTLGCLPRSRRSGSCGPTVRS